VAQGWGVSKERVRDLLPGSSAQAAARPSSGAFEAQGGALMVRYKGRLSAKAIERDFPHFVDMAVPAGGFRTKTHDMAAWHRDRGIESHQGAGSYQEAVWYVRWCFLNEADAVAFIQEFGGARRRDHAKGRTRQTGRQ
jgi:hypothetical protein